MARRGGKTNRDIETYAHAGKERANNPPVGLVTPETDKDVGRKTYAHGSNGQMGAAALTIAASHRAVVTAPRGCLVSYSRPMPENSPKNQLVADESVDLSAMAHELEPALSRLRELLTPLAQAIERELLCKGDDFSRTDLALS